MHVYNKLNSLTLCVLHVTYVLPALRPKPDCICFKLAAIGLPLSNCPKADD